MPIHILKLLKDTCSVYLTDCINSSINNCIFPSTLKWAEIIPIFKNKGDADNKENYRPISILPTISKVFERIMFDQINSFIQNNQLMFLGLKQPEGNMSINVGKSKIMATNEVELLGVTIDKKL